MAERTPRIPMTLIEDEVEYRSNTGLTLRREHGQAENGNAIAGRWVLRDADNSLIDMSRFRHDLADLHNLAL